MTDDASRLRRTSVSDVGDRSIFEGPSQASDRIGARSGGFRQVRACRHKGMPWSGGYGADLPDRFGRSDSGHRQAETALRQDPCQRSAGRMDRL